MLASGIPSKSSVAANGMPDTSPLYLALAISITVSNIGLSMDDIIPNTAKFQFVLAQESSNPEHRKMRLMEIVDERGVVTEASVAPQSFVEHCVDAKAILMGYEK